VEAWPPSAPGVTFRYDTQRSAPALWAAFAAFQTARFGAGVRFDQLFVSHQVFDRDVYGGFARNLPAAAIGADDLGRWGGEGTCDRASTPWWARRCRRASVTGSARAPSPSTRG
jgi:hypothetical protein